MSEYLDLLRQNRNFRNLWLGSVISQFGDWFNILASAELITHLTDSGVALSYLFLARFLPLFLLSPFAGILADRFDRKRIMVLADLLRGVTVLAFLLIRSADQIWLFYLLTVLQFSLSALFTPARSAMLPSIVRREEIVTANALDSLTWSTMLAFGALTGGIVAAVFGVDAAFVADALSFVLSAYFIVRIVAPHQSPVAVATGAPRRFEALDGFRYLLSEPFILGIALAKAGGSLIWGAINVLEITYANDVFPLHAAARVPIADPGTATLGLIYVMGGLGTGVGPLLMRHVLGDAPRRLVLGVSIAFVIFSAGLGWLGLARGLGGVLGATAVRTVGTGTVWVFSAALLQTLVPNRYLGRVSSFEFTALTATQSISVLMAGYMVDTLGLQPQQAVVILAAASLVVTAAWLLFHLHYHRQLQANILPLRAAVGAEPTD